MVVLIAPNRLNHPGTRMPRTTARSLSASVGVLALALLLRWPGLGFLLPVDLEPDAVWAVLTRDLARGIAPAGDHATAYPNLVPYLADAVQRWLAPAASGVLADDLRAAAAPAYAARVVTALGSSAGALFTFLFARRFLSLGWAVWAGCLCAASLLLAQYSVQGRPHALLAGCAAASAWSALRLYERGRLRDSFTCVACLGAGVLVLQSGALFCGVLPLALLLNRQARARFVVLIAGTLTLAALAALAWPRLPWQGGTAHSVTSWEFNAKGLGPMWGWLVAADPLMTVAAALAAATLAARWLAALLARRRERSPAPRALLLGAEFVPFALTFATFHGSYPRFFSPLVPLLALLAAWGMAQLAARGTRTVRALAYGLAVATLGCSLASSARFAWLRTQPSTLDLSARWIEAHVPADEVLTFIAASEFPLYYRLDDVLETASTMFVREGLFWLRFQALTKPDATARGQRIRLIPLEVVLEERDLGEWMREGARPDWVATFGTVRDSEGQGTTMLRRLIGAHQPSFELGALSQDGVSHAMSFDDLGDTPLDTWRRLWSAERLGPVVRLIALF